MTEPTTAVAVLAPVHRRLLEWLSARAVVHHDPAATAVDPSTPGVARARVLVLRSNVRLTAADLASLPRLELVLRAGSGTDNLDLAALRERGVEVVVVGGGPSAPAVAELALQSALSLLRRVPVATAEMAAGRWAKDACLGEELTGTTVGVWGAGPVGRAAARLFTRTDAEVRFAEHPGVPPTERTLPPRRLAATAGVHVFALPLRPETRGTVDRAMLDVLRDRRPHLVNVGRWDLFDMPEVIRALSLGELAGVAVDPVERQHLPLAAELVARFSEPHRPLNLQLTPHLGATTPEAHRRVALAAIDALAARWEPMRHHEGSDSHTREVR